MPLPAIFLDRDGTIIVERNYPSDPEQVELAEGAAAGLRGLARHGFPLVVVSNQSGIGRGYFTVAQADAVQRRLIELLNREGVTIAAWHRCPHAPDADCQCRKPAPGMVHAAARELDLDPARSFVIGDKWADIGLAQAVGAFGILVITGYGAREAERARREGVPVCRDLIEANRALTQHVASNHAQL